MTLAKDAGGAAVSVASSFLPSPWLILGAVIAIGGSYFYGRHDGIPAGKQAVQEEFDKKFETAKTDFNSQLQDKQTQIDKLVSDNNLRITEQNTRISSLEKEARDAADAYAKLEATRDQERKKLLESFRKSPAAKTCAINSVTASVINQMLDVK
jgi:hypothetical protein